MTSARHAIFRADASPELGGGHIMRCLTLADALSRRGWTCSFVAAKGSADVMPALSGGRHRLVEIAAAEAVSPAPLFDLEHADLLVVDHYGLDAAFESACRGVTDQIMVLDDIPGRPHDCDILLDQTLGRCAEAYRGLMRAPDTLILAGPDFALLRPSFAALRPEALARKRERAECVLVSFGASDPLGYCAPAAEASCAAGIPSVDIAVGRACPHLGTLRDLAAREARVHLHVDADPAPLMARADLAIGAAGGTAWERCCLGLPSVVVVAAENQASIARALEMAGAAVVVAPAEGTSPRAVLEAALAALAGAPDELARLRTAAFRICDGWGAPRVAATLLDMRAPDGGRMWLRPVRLDDAALLHDWQSHPETRRFARNPAVPSFEGHLAWLQNRLASPGSLMHIVMHDAQPVGIFRLDRLREAEDSRYEISIAIAPGLYGRGYATAALRLGRTLMPDATYYAEVREGNERSRHLFQAAGYEEVSRGHFLSRGRAT